MSQIQRNVDGNRNQVIGDNQGVAIANVGQYVERLIQNFHLPSEESLALESFWENWSQETDPPFSPKLVIGGRTQGKESILNWLRGTPGVLTLQGDSVEEAIAFFAAVIQTLDEADKARALSRAIVVDGANSWQKLILSSEPLILIARLERSEGVGRAIQAGHHVFVPLGRIGGTNAVSLPRLVRDAAEQSLQEMGLNREQARDLATLARRSLSALGRKRAIAPDTQQPAWARPDEARELLAPLLAGAWEDSSEGDREALAQLSGMSYETLQSRLVRWANEADPPVRRVGEVWMIAAQEDAWRLIACYLTDNDLQRFETVVIAILSELDPAFELSPDQRYAASIYGKVLTRSRLLREGIAGTLALMATLSAEIPFIANRSGEDVARRIVWQLLEKENPDEQLWASLASQLPLLAEAVPDIFLKSVDEGLTGDSPVLVNLFQDRAADAVFMHSSPHTGLLWALETLAWNPDYLGRATLCLVRLARLDPGGRLLNRPIKSLRDIFVCWYPNTTASLESRFAIFDTIRKRSPDIAWHLLMRLLPNRHSIVSPTHGAKWRDWVPNSKQAITTQEYAEATNGILERVLSDAGTSIPRWCSLIAAMAGMTPQQQAVLLQRLEILDAQQFSSKERAEICDRLRYETTRHRDFADADWAMPVEHVQRLEGVYARFEPEDFIDRFCWLFKHGVKIAGMRGKSWQEKDNVVENLRVAALREMINLQGWDSILELSAQVKEPELVGKTLAKAELLPIDLESFLQENLASPESWRSQLSRRVVAVKAYKDGEPWIEQCLTANLSLWTAEQYGEFLLCLPFSGSLLDRLEAADEEVQRYFWSRSQHVNLLDATQAECVLAQLLKFQRPHFAISLISWDLEQVLGIVSPTQIADVLEIAGRTPLQPHFDVSSFAYQSAELLNYLENTDLSRDRLARLEWLYFGIHQHDRRPKILYRELSTNPHLFIEVLQCIFQTKNDPPAEVSDNDRELASCALDFLESWEQMPGVQEDSSVDAEALHTWVRHARELAAECDRSKIADIYIGHALAFSPIDPDGIWPHRAVRDLLENLANPDIESGWCTQIFNNRGVTTRLPTDGGEQERVLVEQYQNYARQISDCWPRTAAVLREIAKDYLHQAAEHDQRAELTQDFWR